MTRTSIARATIHDRRRLAAWLRAQGALVPNARPSTLALACSLDRVEGPALRLTHDDPRWPQWNSFSEAP